ncbi:beta-N-acetylhexosaminidase [Paenibacillus pasadenensis]|uniref:beta-N-acetylhexosaminidase n=1 Tax=Paenibacillus pasadenensis TaxID=217090 RepID=UPI002041C6E9|nr:beta-N-acetylhexosaminidase [Paenibacillus pasadenensis]MCM3747003.1 beta-N-acetylhexosaminidase [Paenibacillus pasadenensis]
MSAIKLSLHGDVEGLEEGIALLAGQLGLQWDDEGLPVRIERADGPLEVSLTEQGGCIRFADNIHFFRCLGLFMEAAAERESFHIIEEPQFTMNGMMIDASRNGVMRVDGIKRMLRLMAVMGLNMMMLYTEDTYEIKSRPYFGYMRGRYTFDELKECDDYAAKLGIEIIPCIQTLAHLSEALKWSFAEPMKDSGDILLVGSEETYAFIDEMIDAASAPFRSRRIHIGMDEAMSLGLGHYLAHNGYRRRIDIMNEHLARVKEIVAAKGLKPMLWSDMYFRLASKFGGYYDPDAVVPEDIIRDMPKDAQLVYWDYYHSSTEEYENFISKHKEFGCDVIFAGGIWTWGGTVVNYKISFGNTNPALTACKRQGIKEVFATLWGDNGTETNVFSALLGLQLYAEHGYSHELDMEKLHRRFQFCTGGNAEAFLSLTEMDVTPLNEEEWRKLPPNPSKYLLWQDPLIGLFDRHAEGKELSGYYETMAAKLAGHRDNSGEWAFVFDMPQKLAAVLAVKADIGIRLKDSYDRNDLEALRQLAGNVLPDLTARVEELRAAHCKQWFGTYKAFGWEVIDLRYGGLLARIDTARRRIEDYVQGHTDNVEELAADRLYFDGPDRPEGAVFGWCNQYRRIASASMQ